MIPPLWDLEGLPDGVLMALICFSTTFMFLALTYAMVVDL